MNNTSKNVMVILWALVVLAIAACVPLISVWSINTLFSLNIAYTFSTWFAAFWVSAVTLGARYYGKK